MILQQLESLQIQQQFLNSYPDIPTHITFAEPYFRLRIGDFKDQGEAAAALSRVRSAFPAFSGQMMLVKDNVNVWSK